MTINYMITFYRLIIIISLPQIQFMYQIKLNTNLITKI